VIAGFEHRWQVEAQLAAFEHERKGAQTAAHLEAIAEQEAIFPRRARADGSGGRLRGAQARAEPRNGRLGRHARPRADHRLMKGRTKSDQGSTRNWQRQHRESDQAWPGEEAASMKRGAVSYRGEGKAASSSPDPASPAFPP